MADASWKMDPGRPRGPEVPIEDLLTKGYEVHAYLHQAYKREPPERRVRKGRFADRIRISRPTVNKYLKGGGIPFPFPPADHLVWVVDAEDGTVLWMGPSSRDHLLHDPDFYIGADAHARLRGQKATEPGHREAIEVLKRDTTGSQTHECQTTFIRGDGRWQTFEIRVSYGALYRVWFGDAIPVGAPEDAPTIVDVLQAQDRPEPDGHNTYDTILVDTSINPDYRATLPPELLTRQIIEYKRQFVQLPSIPSITISPDHIILEVGGLNIIPRAERERQDRFMRSLNGHEPGPPHSESTCTTCRGFGYVRRELPVDHPEFGQAMPCPQCQA